MKLRLSAVAAAMLVASTTSNSQTPQASGADTVQGAKASTAKESAVLDHAERVTKATEAWELTGSSVFDGQQQAPELGKVSEGLAGYLTAHPGDVRALVLKGRTLRAQIVVSPVTIKLEDKGGHVTSGDTTQLRNDALAALDEALKLDPKNAEAFYWKARTLMLSDPAAEQVGAEKAPDSAPAIDAARMAVNLAPANTTYREYLALSLIGVGQSFEGLQELEKLPTKHPLVQLMDDMDVVPAPADAEPDQDRGYEIASSLFSGRMDVFRFPGFRARAYVVSASPAALQAHYARTWPGMHWVKKPKNPSIFAGFLWSENKLEPMSDPSPFTGNYERQLPPSGLLMVISRDEETKPARTLLYIVDFRRF